MSKILGKEAYKAARKQTMEKLSTLRKVVFAAAKEDSDYKSEHISVSGTHCPYAESVYHKECVIEDPTKVPEWCPKRKETNNDSS